MKLSIPHLEILRSETERPIKPPSGSPPPSPRWTRGCSAWRFPRHRGHRWVDAV